MAIVVLLHDGLQDDEPDDDRVEPPAPDHDFVFCAVPRIVKGDDFEHVLHRLLLRPDPAVGRRGQVRLAHVVHEDLDVVDARLCIDRLHGHGDVVEEQGHHEGAEHLVEEVDSVRRLRDVHVGGDQVLHGEDRGDRHVPGDRHAQGVGGPCGVPGPLAERPVRVRIGGEGDLLAVDVGCLLWACGDRPVPGAGDSEGVLVLGEGRGHEFGVIYGEGEGVV